MDKCEKKGSDSAKIILLAGPALAGSRFVGSLDGLSQGPGKPVSMRVAVREANVVVEDASDEIR